MATRSNNSILKELEQLICKNSTDASDLETLQILINQVKTENRIDDRVFTFDIPIDGKKQTIDEGALLHLAASNGNVNAVHLLLKVGANISQKTKNGLNAHHIAAANGHTDIVTALLAAGADINAKYQVRVYLLYHS